MADFEKIYIVCKLANFDINKWKEKKYGSNTCTSKFKFKLNFKIFLPVCAQFIMYLVYHGDQF